MVEHHGLNTSAVATSSRSTDQDGGDGDKGTTDQVRRNKRSGEEDRKTSAGMRPFCKIGPIVREEIVG